MSVERYSTLGQSILSSAYTSGGTSLVVASASSFPSAGNFRVRVDDEIFKVTAVSGTTFTVTGAQEGTSAANHSSGATVTEVLTAAALDAIRSDMTSIGTYASLPSTTGQTAGNQYHTTDSIYQYVYNGSAWQPYFRGFPATAPVLGNFTQTNFGTSTTDTTHGGISMACQTDTSDSQRMLTVAQPSTPYTLKAVFCPIYTETNTSKNQYCGIGFYDGTKIVHIVRQIDGKVKVYRWSNTTSFSAEQYTQGQSLYQIWAVPYTLIITNDGSTLRFRMCGADWFAAEEVYNESVGTFITPTHLCFTMANNNKGYTATLASWATY